MAPASDASRIVTELDGSGSFLMPEATGVTKEPLRVFYHRPSDWPRDGRVLIVMHGTNRNAGRYLAEWRKHADAYRFLLVCPEMTKAKYPGSRYYNTGNVFDSDDGDGNPQPREQWVFPVIDRVFAEVRARFGATTPTFSLFGHSAGAQFVHRYLQFAPDTQADTIITANAGWYTMPERKTYFPYGLQNVPVRDEDLARAFARPVIVLLGDNDTNPNHSSLRRDVQADRQGLNRFQRGHSFFSTARARAAAMGVPFAWRLVTVPGVGHSNAGMADAAIKLISKVVVTQE